MDNLEILSTHDTGRRRKKKPITKHDIEKDEQHRPHQTNRE